MDPLNYLSYLFNKLITLTKNQEQQKNNNPTAASLTRELKTRSICVSIHLKGVNILFIM